MHVDESACHESSSHPSCWRRLPAGPTSSLGKPTTWRTQAFASANQRLRSANPGACRRPCQRQLFRLGNDGVAFGQWRLSGRIRVQATHSPRASPETGLAGTRCAKVCSPTSERRGGKFAVSPKPSARAMSSIVISVSRKYFYRNFRAQLIEQFARKDVFSRLSLRRSVRTGVSKWAETSCKLVCRPSVASRNSRTFPRRRPDAAIGPEDPRRS